MRQEQPQNKQPRLTSTACLGYAVGQIRRIPIRAEGQLFGSPHRSRRASMNESSHRTETGTHVDRCSFAWFFLISKQAPRLPIMQRSGCQITEWCECDGSAKIVLEANEETNPGAYRIVAEHSSHFPFVGLCATPLRRLSASATGPNFELARWDVVKNWRFTQGQAALGNVDPLRPSVIKGKDLP